MDEHKTKRLMQIVNHSYVPWAGYVEWGYVDGQHVPVGKYIKYPKNSKRQKWLKKYSNKIVRRNSVPPKGNSYRKMFEYNWKLY